MSCFWPNSICNGQRQGLILEKPFCLGDTITKGIGSSDFSAHQNTVLDIEGGWWWLPSFYGFSIIINRKIRSKPSKGPLLVSFFRSKGFEPELCAPSSSSCWTNFGDRSKDLMFQLHPSVKCFFIKVSGAFSLYPISLGVGGRFHVIAAALRAGIAWFQKGLLARSCIFLQKNHLFLIHSSIIIYQFILAHSRRGSQGN